MREGVPSPGTPPEPEPVRRIFRAEDGSTWEVEVAGRGCTGRPDESRASILLLVFRRPEGHSEPARETGPGADDGGAREALAAVDALEHLSDEALEILMRRGRPHRPDPGDVPEFFPGTRGRGRG